MASAVESESESQATELREEIEKLAGQLVNNEIDWDEFERLTIPLELMIKKIEAEQQERLEEFNATVWKESEARRANRDAINHAQGLGF